MRLFAIALVLALTAGCSNGVTGTPTAQIWEPCTLPRDTLVNAGIDPEIRGDDFLGVDTGWTTCLYSQRWYTLMFLVSPMDLEQTLQFLEAERRQVETFGPKRRPGVRFEDSQSSGPTCNVALRYAVGTIVLSTSKYEHRDAEGDLCTEVLRLTENLVAALPS